MRRISGKIHQLKKLERLNLEGNHLNRLPLSINELKKLELLDLTSNKFKQCPNIYDLKKMRWLRLDKNKIKDLPSEFEGLIGLEQLILSNNKLKKMPQVIERLNNLSFLCVDENEIKSLDINALLKLHKLEYLRLDGNHFKVSNKLMFKLKHIKQIGFIENPYFE